MPHDVLGTMDAICELHKEWGTLIALRHRVRAAPYDDSAERHLVDRLRSHQAKLGALRATILEDQAAHPQTPAPSPMRAGHPAH